MSETHWFEVGYVSKAHGIKGEIFVRLNAGRADWWRDGLSLRFINREQQETVLTPVHASFHKDGLILDLHGISDRSTAEKWVGAKVYISSELLQSAAGETIFLHEILAFKLCDGSGRFLGLIKEFKSNGAQDILCVSTGDSDYAMEVPLVSEWVVKLDEEAGELWMELPEGLLHAD